MTTPHVSLPGFFSRWSHHLVAMFTVLSLVWVGWLGWQAYEQWYDHPLPADRVSAKQIRVNDAARKKLVSDLTHYQDPAATATMSSVTFQGGTTSR